ncbi:hypothetical protein BGZ80_007255, partial [Entomortierella chlamydospora]
VTKIHSTKPKSGGSAMGQEAYQDNQSVMASTATASISAPTTSGPGTMAAPVEIATRS